MLRRIRMDEIKVGDMVMWYEDPHSAKKVGQVFGIDGDMANIFCQKDSAVYFKPLNQLKKIQ